MRKSTLLILGLLAALLTGVGCNKGGDAIIAADLKAKIAADAELSAAGVAVQVSNGQVTLTGNVPNSDVELKAVKLANAQPGVKKVNDQLKLQAAPMDASAASPSATVSQPVASAPASSAAPQPAPASPPPAQVAQQAPPPQAEPQPAPAPPPQPAALTIPAGRAISIRMIDSIDSSRNQAGQEFRASLAAPVRVHGTVVAPRGADVTVRLVNAKSAGTIRGRSELELELVNLRVRGRRYPLTSNRYTQVGKSRGAQTAKRTGIGAAAGAVIGAIAGGGKGAAIGAAVGGGGTATYQVLTRGQQIRIPSETELSFVLQAPATID
ncbi:MAG TPA: BON domain-containing protein [Bryobacteraceae bacterium]|jgi:hypothetical protein|nr:BON domain-containing protein [Bryobacteraceae bacterium]